MTDNKDKKRLVEVKSGETGYGLLIENDGYVSMDVSDGNRKMINEIFETKKDGEWHVPNPFIMDVVLQKFDTENANKRIYPEAILKREVEKYQRLIREKMAFGECYKPDAEVLTDMGWKKLEDVTIEDTVFTMDVNSNNDEKRFSYEKPIIKIEKDFDGEMITVKSDKSYGNEHYGINDIVTPGHEYPVFELVDGVEFKFKTYVKTSELKGVEGFIPVNSRPSLHSYKNSDGQELNFADIKDLKFGVEEYTGKVMCLKMPKHTFLVKCNNKIHWTKNCNHPAEAVIDLGRVAINVIECHWEGKTLVGKVEFNLTEGFRRYGICSSLGDTCANLVINGFKIGVSSRGVGSVESRLGKSFVAGDFELLCFDVVHSPSTPGAYLGDYEDLTQYIESEQKDEKKSRLNEKIEKIKNILI